MMKRIIIITAFTITCSSLSSCTQFTPAPDNNLVMMRANDIQLKQDVIDRQKYTNEPTHFFSLKRFFSDLLHPKKLITTPPTK